MVHEAVSEGTRSRSDEACTCLVADDFTCRQKVGREANMTVVLPNQNLKQFCEDVVKLFHRGNVVGGTGSAMDDEHVG